MQRVTKSGVTFVTKGARSYRMLGARSNPKPALLRLTGSAAVGANQVLRENRLTKTGAKLYAIDKAGKFRTKQVGKIADRVKAFITRRPPKLPPT